MNFNDSTWWLALFIFSGISSGLTYLLKQALFNKVEKMENKLSAIEVESVRKNEHSEDVKELKNDIETIKANYTTKNIHIKDYDECRKDIKRITEDYITKEDFFREQGKTDRKLDKIMDILLDMKGAGENER